jgi:IPT/TIG domain
VDVTVATAGGPSAPNASDQFTFVAAPSVASLSPNSGPISGGTAVTLTGANFTGATAVDFGDTAVGFTVNNDTSLTVVSPVGESVDTVDITVTTVGGTSPTGAADQFAYTTAQLRASVSPTAGAPGTAVGVSGGGFASGETVNVKYKTGLASPAAVLLCTATAVSDGSFACFGAIPTTRAGAIGSHKIVAKGTTSLAKATTVFTLT